MPCSVTFPLISEGTVGGVPLTGGASAIFPRSLTWLGGVESPNGKLKTNGKLSYPVAVTKPTGELVPPKPTGRPEIVNCPLALVVANNPFKMTVAPDMGFNVFTSTTVPVAVAVYPVPVVVK